MRFHGRISLVFLFVAFLAINPAFAAQAPFYQGTNITFLINFAAGGHLARHIPAIPQSSCRTWRGPEE